jgi:hypothetical protein
MAHFANLDSDNKVVLVLFVDNSDCLGGNSNEIEAAGIAHLQKHHPEITGTWKQTSYNKTFRKNYAGIGYTYDAQRDAFIPPKSYPSWVLNETTCDCHINSLLIFFDFNDFWNVSQTLGT